MRFLPLLRIALLESALATLTHCAAILGQAGSDARPPGANGGADDDSKHGLEELVAGTGTIIDGDGRKQQLAEMVFGRVRRALELTLQSSVAAIADIQRCRGYGDAFCHDQLQYSAHQRDVSAQMALEMARAILDQIDRLHIQLSPTKFQATDGAKRPILVESQPSPRYWNVILVWEGLIEAFANGQADAAFAQQRFELVLIHEMMHTVLHADGTRSNDYDEAEGYENDPSPWRSSSYVAARAILAHLYRTADPPICSFVMAPSQDIPLEMNGSPIVTQFTLPFQFGYQPADRAATAIAVPNGGVDWNVGANYGTARMNLNATSITGTVRDKLTGLDNSCTVQIGLNYRPVSLTTLHRVYAPLAGGGNVFSYNTDGSVPSGWHYDGPMGVLSQTETPNCNLRVSIVPVPYTNGVLVGSGSILSLANGGYFAGYLCRNAFAGQHQIRQLRHPNVDMYVATGSENEYQTYLGAHWYEWAGGLGASY